MSTYEVRMFDADFRDWVVLKKFNDLKEAKEFYRQKQIELWEKEDESLLSIEEETED